MTSYTRDDIEFETWYTPWMKDLARNNTVDELNVKLHGAKVEAKKSARIHLKAIERTHSMSGNSQSRAQTRNVTAAAGDYAIALHGALEIHELFPEYAKCDQAPTNILRPSLHASPLESLEDFELLITSIKEDGFTLPVIVNDGSKDPALKNMIIDGEHRWRAANVLEMPTVPVVYKAMDQAEMRASTIRHNVARGHHDSLMEANLLRELSQGGMTAEEMNAQLNIDPVELSVMLDNAVNYDDAKELGKMLEAEQLAELNGRGVTGDGAQTIAGRHATIEARTLTQEQDGKQASNESGQNVRFELVYSGEQADFMRKMVSKYGSALNALKAVRDYARRYVA